MGLTVPVLLKRRIDLVVLALVSYVPTLVTSWGRLNADTKLYLGEDTTGLIARSASAWDPSQFGGFVPHQAIAYLWPTGPFYWLLGSVGAPQWVIQRLWVGTLFFAASTGVAVLLRWLGFSRVASVVGAIFFQASPYVLSYQSRTSSMLLPFAAVGWLSYMAARGIRSTGWRWPALIALTVCTVAPVNATAMLMVLPAPVILAIHSLAQTRRWRTGVMFSIRTALLTAAASAWWIAILLIQSRYGAELLTYSETLEAVASTSNAFEVFRGFGYWLNYVGLDGQPLTSAARTIFESPTFLVATTVLPLAALMGTGLATRGARRVGAWLVFVGAVLAVGVHPLDDALPFVGHLADNPTSTPALALRSSTRAIPVMLMGLAIGLAALVDHRWRIPRRTSRPPRTARLNSTTVSVALVVVLIVLSNPTKWTTGTFEPTLERTPVPSSWRTLGAEFDDLLGDDARVMQFPGQEFGAYTWGHTIDPALPAVTDASLLTRDLIPLGNTTMMNVLWEMDDALRQGRMTAPALDTMAGLLGAQAVLFPGDLDDARYATPSQRAVLTANGLGQAARTGAGASAVHRFTTHPTSAQQRLSPSQVVLLGDGKGVVDAAVAEVTGGRTVRLAGHISDPEMAQAIAAAAGIIVTDTNTERAQQWRTSYATTGFDEDREGLLQNFFDDPSDIRMRIFDKRRSDDSTWYEQVGPVRARVSSYGPPLSYRPEHRAYAAIDGDPTTSWQVANGVEPASPVIQLLSDEVIERISLLQPQESPNRIITRVSISDDAVNWKSQKLGPESLDTGQLIELASPSTSVIVRIDEVRTVRPLSAGEELSGVGFAEIDTFQAPTTEVGFMPSRGLEHASADTALTYVMTRRRAPVDTLHRSDIESTWAREFVVPDARRMSLRVTIDTTDMDDPTRADTLAALAAGPVVILDDRVLVMTVTEDGSDGTIVAVTGPIEMEPGSHRLQTSNIVVDQIVFSDGASASIVPMPSVIVESSSATSRTLRVPACPEGCWLEFAQGFNSGWRATSDDVALASAVPINGGTHGWWIPPSDVESTITLRFTPQRWLDYALLASLVAVLLCLLLIVRTASGEHDHDPDAHEVDPAEGAKASRVLVGRALHVMAVAAVMALVSEPKTAVIVAAIASAAMFLRRTHEAMGVAMLAVGVAVLSSLWEVLDAAPALDFAWPSVTNGSHHMIVTALAATALMSTLPASPSRAAGVIAL